MSKRKLTQQQQRRVAAHRAKPLDTPERTGLVIAHYGSSLDVEDDNGNIIVCGKRQHLGTLVPGDRVTWQMDTANNSAVVVRVAERNTLLSRPDSRGELHAVAANVDHLFIVIAPTPAPSQTTVDRYLIAATVQNIQPIIVLNKEDLLPEDPHHTQLLELLELYKSLQIPCLIVSAKCKSHLSLLDAYLLGKTSVFVGQSGVGKSSIIGTLIPGINIKTGDLSILGKHGKHTTTTARLYHLPQGGNIIDSPGIREFPLWPMSPAELAYGFIEFREFLHDCKFRNCTHVNEPSCALLNAAAAGKIKQARILSYQKILASML
jgi:ribosome biogenesis GTPase